MRTGAALNAKFRRVAMRYIAKYPLGRMVIIQKIFKPFRKLLLDQIGLGNDRWERKQRNRGAEQVAGDRGAAKVPHGGFSRV